tara:strand:+ start:1805 stop:1990 length:186 start_codon:yes stop_codon:yes gene_type:complete
MDKQGRNKMDNLINSLIDEWAVWCKDQGFKCMDAMELIMEHDLTPNQSDFVDNFIKRWEVA